MSSTTTNPQPSNPNGNQFVGNPNCPACIAKRLHSKEETSQFHPYSGHGYIAGSKGQAGKWSHPDLAAEAVKEKK